MLGKTNLLFVAEDEAAELAFKPEYILTSSSGSITKIEYINNLFFVFTKKDEVLYGSDINKLQLINKDGATFGAKHIIYTNNSYYLADANLETKKAVIYKTTNFSTYEEVVLKNLEDDAGVKGLFISSENQIVALIERKLAGSGNNYYYEYDLLTTDSLSNYSEENAIYQNYDLGSVMYSATYIPKMKKDRIFALIRHNNYGSGNGYVLSLNGKYNAVTNVYSWFASDHFFYYGGSSGVVGYPLYYSFNGIDYIRLDFDHIKSFLALNIFEYDGSIAMIYSCEEDGKKVQKFTTSATPKGLIDATKSAIPVSIDYTMISDSELYKDDYVYLGCTGGIIIKGQIDNAEVIRPDVVVVKGMAAKEALRQANDYTDEKYKNTTKEVKEIEETTRQYMENAFSATPKGYAELVDTVNENTVKIGIITEKAELNIKETASGEEIYLFDPANGKPPEFALFGKARQQSTSGNQLANLPNLDGQVANGVTWSCKNGIVVAEGNPTDASSSSEVNLYYNFPIMAGDYFVSGSTTNVSVFVVVTKADGSKEYFGDRTFKLDGTEQLGRVFCQVRNTSIGTTISDTVYPMLNKGTTALPFESYTGGKPSPNPDYPQEIEVSGESYNLLDNTATNQESNGIVWTVNNDGSVTANGTATNKENIYISSNYKFSQAGEYVLSGCPKGGSATAYRLLCGLKNTDGTSLGDNIDYGDGVSFTVTQEMIDTGMYALVGAYVMSGVKVENLTFYPMIRKASVKNDRYMPYGKGSVEVKSVGKNKMVLDQSLNTDSEYFTYSSNTQELISVTVNRLSKFIATFKATLKKGETYTISINASRGLAINIYSDKIWGNGVGAFGVKDNKTFTFDGESGEYIIGIYADSSSTIGEVISLSNLQLEKGTVATEYEPYRETVSTIPTENGIAGIPVSSGGNYTDQSGQQWICDEVVKYTDGSGEKIQRVGQSKLADLTWIYEPSTNNKPRFISKDLIGIIEEPNASDYPNALCESYRVLRYAESFEKYTDKTMCIIYKTSGMHGQIWVNNTDFDNVEDFKNSLGDTLFYYQLAEPIRTPLTAEEIAEIEKLSTFYPVTNISNDFDCGMRITYLADSKNYINRKVAEQVASIVENIK